MIDTNTHPEENGEENVDHLRMCQRLLKLAVEDMRAGRRKETNGDLPGAMELYNQAHARILKISQTTNSATNGEVMYRGLFFYFYLVYLLKKDWDGARMYLKLASIGFQPARDIIALGGDEWKKWRFS